MLSLRDLADLSQSFQILPVREFSLGSRFFPFNSEPAIMGVINLSPDSWYRESVCLTADQAVARGKVLTAQGAAMVDIGAESTLGHAARLDGSSQVEKLLPVISALNLAGIIVSAETYLASVAEVALLAGARVINLTGTAEAEAVYALAAKHHAAVIICYVQGVHARAVGDFQPEQILDSMKSYFKEQIALAEKAGLGKIIIDPGMGFYYRNLADGRARIKYQMRLFLQTFELRALGFPVCHALPHAFGYFQDEVRCAEPFFAVLAALGKTDLFRTHEVPRVKAVLDTLSAF